MKYVAALASALILSAPVAAQSEADIEGVRAAVMAYVEAGNTGSSELARQAFETDQGVMFIRRPGEDGEADHVEPMNLGDFADRFGNPSGDRPAEIRDIRIVEDTVAWAHLHMVWGEREVDDMFLLYKLNGEWKIVAKTFVFH
ncbi:nuclear transport factor 2 family protein [Maricaulis sp. CAU 1757]